MKKKELQFDKNQRETIVCRKSSPAVGESLWERRFKLGFSKIASSNLISTGF